MACQGTRFGVVRLVSAKSYGPQTLICDPLLNYKRLTLKGGRMPERYWPNCLVATPRSVEAAGAAPVVSTRTTVFA